MMREPLSKLDHADLHVFGETRGTTLFVEAIDRDALFAVALDGAGEVEDLGELVALADVLEGAGIIFGGEEIIAVLEPEAFADIFERIGVGPADADGFFGQRNGLFALFVN